MPKHQTTRGIAVLTTHALLIFAAVYAVAVATPGPGIVTLVARAIGGGFRSAVPMVFGMAAGDLALMTLSAFGLALVAQAMGDFFLIVKLAGAAYVVYLGYKYWTAPVAETLTTEPGGAAQGFLSQLALTLGNPKAIGFFVAPFPCPMISSGSPLTAKIFVVLNVPSLRST